ncbi:hypothetical protein CUD01_31730 [Cellulomonas uda]|uniref:Uncharacterized protein n=1 Tax=Cellulomonas uda TaxID=1714 RepID=A0A4Y3KE70_CELUD|nr:hypothetical protein CUD01_31730 [Cellulomonas uda]
MLDVVAWALASRASGDDFGIASGPAHALDLPPGRVGAVRLCAWRGILAWPCEHAAPARGARIKRALRNPPLFHVER